MLIHKCLYKVGPINFGTLRCDLCIALTYQGTSLLSSRVG
jgi:hypothetical protein